MGEGQWLPGSTSRRQHIIFLISRHALAGGSLGQMQKNRELTGDRG